MPRLRQHQTCRTLLLMNTAHSRVPKGAARPSHSLDFTRGSQVSFRPPTHPRTLPFALSALSSGNCARWWAAASNAANAGKVWGIQRRTRDMAHTGCTCSLTPTPTHSLSHTHTHTHTYTHTHSPFAGMSFEPPLSIECRDGRERERERERECVCVCVWWCQAPAVSLERACALSYFPHSNRNHTNRSC
jgi:hypothetical protein